MSTTHIIGIDLGKNTFHVAAHDKRGNELFRKKLSRSKLVEFLSCIEPSIIAMESCGGAHWLARKCESLGHIAKLIPPQYVKPYVKTNKNDFGRNFAAWIGLVPIQYSTGGKTTMLGISKRGNRELRTLFIHAARSILWRDKSVERFFGS